MNEFYIFFTTGIQHITDFNGLDHFLFIAALCLGYAYKDWKQLLVLITAFTIGHSLTLALSTLHIINVPIKWTEVLIAVTIFITAINNILTKQFNHTKKYPLIYFFALVFGFIHGLGFSTMLRSMLGQNQNIVVQLLAFNIGLEIGQFIIVVIILFISFIFVSQLKISRRKYIVFASGAIAALALQMMIERFSFIKF